MFVSKTLYVMMDYLLAHGVDKDVVGAAYDAGIAGLE